MANNDPIASALGLTPMVQASNSNLPARIEHEIKSDEYETAKKNVENVMKVGTHALNQMAQIADASQNSKDYRVITEMMQAMLAASKTYMDLKKDNVAIKQAESSDQTGQVQQLNQTNVYLSTSELLELMAEKDEPEAQ